MTWVLVILVLIPVLLLLFSVATYRACKGQWWPLMLFFAIPIALMYLANRDVEDLHTPREPVLVEVSESRSENARTKAILISTDAKSSSQDKQTALDRPERPTAELWEELTKSRIDLDGDAKNALEASHASETAEDADAEATQNTPPPKWVESKPKPIGNVYRVVVQSDPFSTEDECFDQLEGMFDKEIRNRLKKILPADQRGHVHGASLSEIGIPISYVMRDICRESYTELRNTSVGYMKSVHVLMEFDSGVEQELRSHWIAYQRRQGLGLVSKIAALVLSALAICYSLLQIDTWTRGYYSKRLLAGLPVAIIAVALLVFS